MQMIGKYLAVSVIAVALLPFWVRAAENADSDKPQLCQGNYQTEEQAKEQLARFAKTYSTQAEWQQRAQRIHEGILRGAELWPLPKKCPLNPIIHSKRVYDGYSVENVAIESLPGGVRHGELVHADEGRRAIPGGALPARALGRSQRLRPVPSGHAETLRDVCPDGRDRLRL